jgi:phosphohistidine phosphatase SixA
MRVYVVRHGEKVEGKGNQPLTASGVEMSRAAGAWIAADGARVVRVLVSRMTRTHQTADALLSALAPTPVGRDVYPSGLAVPGGLERLLDGFPSEGDVVIVVHGGTQDRVERALGGRRFEIPEDNRAAVYRLERTERGWWATAACEGRPKARLP